MPVGLDAQAADLGRYPLAGRGRAGVRLPDLPGGRATWAAAALALVPLAVAVVRAVRADDFAVHGDAALIELRVRDVGGPDTPLLGSYQRFGWRQPGPFLFYVLAVPYRVLGSSFAGMQVGAVLLAAAGLVGAVVLLRRWAGPVPALAFVVLASALGHSLGARITDPWEPVVTLFPLALFLVLVAGLVAGHARALPAAAVVASLLAQAQTTLVPVVGLLATVGVAALIVTAWRARGRPHPVRWRRPLGCTAAALGLLWLPPLLHELDGEPSNVGRLWRFATGGADGEALGLGRALDAIRLQLGADAPWITGATPLEFPAGTVDLTAAGLPLAGLALLAGWMVAVRRRDRFATALAATAGLALAAAVLAMSRLVGPLFDWVLLWTWVVALTCWLAAATCAWRALPRRWRAAACRPVQVALVVAVAVLAARNVAAVTDPVPAEEDRLRTTVVGLADRAVDALGEVDGPVLVRSSMDLEEQEVFTGAQPGVELLGLALERHGIEVAVDDVMASKLGDHRADRRDGAVAEVRLATDDGATAPDGADVVATVDPLTDADREELARIRAELRSKGLDDVARDDIPAGPEAGLTTLAVATRDRLEGYPDITLWVHRR